MPDGSRTLEFRPHAPEGVRDHVAPTSELRAYRIRRPKRDMIVEDAQERVAPTRLSS